MGITKQEYLDMFQSKAGKEELVRSLRNLPRSKGWQILMIYFNELLESNDELLHNISNDLSNEELQRIRIRLYYIKEMMETPEGLANEILASEEEGIPDDIYN